MTVMENFELDALYKDIILEHHKDPRNFGVLNPKTGSIEKFNPLCGDHVVLDVVLSEDGQSISDIRFQGEGCSISVASTSMMTEQVKGKSLKESIEMIDQVREMMQGKACPLAEGNDLEALSGVKRFPVRIKCALLSWTALREWIAQQKTMEKMP